MNFSKISAFAALIGSGIVGFAATPAMAATFASEVYDMNGNPLGDGIQTPGMDGRYDVDNTLSKNEDDKFYSMDFDQSLIFGFGGKKFNTFKLWETTDRENWAERVKVSVGNSLDGTFVDIGYVLNDEKMTDYIDVGGMYKFLKITEATEGLYGDDFENSHPFLDGNGFDIDAIFVKYADVPEPTSILGLLAVSGLGAAVVRKRKQNIG